MSTRIGRAREALAAACVGGKTPAERVHAFPQTGAYPTPCAWVGLPTVRSARSSTTLTIPVVIVVDGGDAEQFAAIDDETAVKVVDGTVDVVSEGHWKLLTPRH